MFICPLPMRPVPCVEEGGRVIVGNLQKIFVGVPVQPERAKDGDA